MSFQINCPRCNQIFDVTEKARSKALSCPGCRQSLIVPSQRMAMAEPTATRPCPQCDNPLHLFRELHGQQARCVKCGTRLAIFTDPWRVSVVDGRD